MSTNPAATTSTKINSWVKPISTFQCVALSMGNILHRMSKKYPACCGFSRPVVYFFKNFEYPCPYWTLRDTRLKVAEEMLDWAIT